MLRLVVVALVVGLVSCQGNRRPVKEYEINLDLAPEKRFTQVIHDFNNTIQSFYDALKNDALLKDFLKALVDVRGPEPAEMQGEIKGVSQLTNVPEPLLQAINMLYELQTLMVPIENLTLPRVLGREIPKLPWRGPGCTGIIATDKDDGTVYHARNLDFSPGPVMQDLVYIGKFTKGGKEVFRAQMEAAYSCPLTAMKAGPNGFAVETNTRYTSHEGGNEEMLKNLLEERRPLNGWSVRKIIENSDGYEAAVAAMSTTKFVATQYNIISGVKKGTILARDPDGVAKALVLGKTNPLCRDDYIIITNFDYWDHDIREWFDPTGTDGIGHPRRIVAQRMLNGTKVLTPTALFDTIDAKGVRATDTIFQAIINVEKGLFNSSLPPL